MRKTDWKAILFNASFALNCMLLFLLIFESSLRLPAWVQVIGRMHPLLLHFPLVLIIVYAVLAIVQKNPVPGLLLMAAFTAVLTAIMGLFLSKEEGYDPEALVWHKWGGVAISVFSLLWYWLRARRVMTMVASVIAVFLIVVTGHLGASITHGEGFLLAPVKPAEQTIAFEDAEVFEHMVRPILAQKCMSCHNQRKAKGELVMETEELLLKGGKNGKLWDTAEADLGLLLHRVHLPLQQKEHMPPKNKPQLTDEEIEILTQWIKRGASFELKVAELPPADTLYQIAQGRFITQYDFAAADPAVVSKLNTANRVVNFEATGSPALAVSFFNSALFNSAQLTDLKEIKKQIVSLNLARMPLKDEDIKFISEFENLRHLNLSFTGINNLTELKKLQSLQSLSLSGTNISAAQLEPLSVKTLYVWNTPLSKQDIEQLQKKFNVQTGFKGDTVTLKLSPPVSLNERKIIKDTAIALKLKHYVQGAIIHYTMDGGEPDSIHSAVFKGTETLNTNAVIKAKAYKPGWISSDILEINFIKNTYTPDSVIYVTKPDVKYPDPKQKLLIDGESGELNFQIGNWVAFRQNKMECILPFSKPVTIQSIGLSGLVDVGAYIMPPASIELWGGNDPNQLKLLGRLQPKQPSKPGPSFMTRFECSFKPVTVKYVKIVAAPVGKLPKWHPGKGDKAWIFVDEILVN